MLNALDGLVMGTANGISPGPLLTLIVAQTIRFGMREGVKISLTPIIGSIPVIGTSLAVYAFFSQSLLLLGLISFVGTIFLILMGVSHLRAKPIQEVDQGTQSHASWIKGTLATILSPGAYAFWISIGAPLAIKSFDNGYSQISIFLAAFFFGFFASNFVVVFLSAKASRFLTGQPYMWAMRGLGLVLIAYSVLFFHDGLQKVGLI